MNTTESLSVLQVELTQKFIPQIIDLLAEALAEGWPVHEVEAACGIWPSRSAGVA